MQDYLGKYLPIHPSMVAVKKNTEICETYQERDLQHLHATKVDAALLRTNFHINFLLVCTSGVPLLGATWSPKQG